MAALATTPAFQRLGPLGAQVLGSEMPSQLPGHIGFGTKQGPDGFIFDPKEGYAPFFGISTQANGPLDPIAQDVEDSARAYKGVLVLPTRATIHALTKDQSWPLRLLPPTKTDYINVEWTTFRTKGSPLDQLADEAPPRERSYEERSGRAALEFRGTALRFEKGFFNTPIGQQKAIAQFAELDYSVTAMAQFGAIWALSHATPAPDSAMEQFGRRMSEADFHRLLVDRLNTAGLINKTRGGISMIMNKLKDEMLERQGIVPSAFITGIKTEPYRGELQLPPGMEWLQAHTYSMGDGYRSNALEMPVFIGVGANSSPSDIHDVPLASRTSAMRTMIMHDADGRRFFNMTLGDMLNSCGLFDTGTGEWPLTREIGVPILSKYRSWGDMAARTGCLDEWVRSILKLDGPAKARVAAALSAEGDHQGARNPQQGPARRRRGRGRGNRGGGRALDNRVARLNVQVPEGTRPNDDEHQAARRSLIMRLLGVEPIGLEQNDPDLYGRLMDDVPENVTTADLGNWLLTLIHGDDPRLDPVSTSNMSIRATPQDYQVRMSEGFQANGDTMNATDIVASALLVAQEEVEQQSLLAALRVQAGAVGGHVSGPVSISRSVGLQVSVQPAKMFDRDGRATAEFRPYEAAAGHLLSTIRHVAPEVVNNVGTAMNMACMRLAASNVAGDTKEIVAATFGVALNLLRNSDDMRDLEAFGHLVAAASVNHGAMMVPYNVIEMRLQEGDRDKEITAQTILAMLTSAQFVVSIRGDLGAMREGAAAAWGQVKPVNLQLGDNGGDQLDTYDAVETALAKAPIVNGQVIRVCFEEDALVPFAFYVARPAVGLMTSAALMVQGGGACGRTYWNQPRIEFGDHVSTSMLYCKFTIRFASVITNIDAVAQIPSVHISAYNGGLGSRIWVPSPQARADYRSGRGGGPGRRSIFVLAQPANERFDRRIVDLAAVTNVPQGANYVIEDEGGATMSNNDVYTAYWGWRKGVTQDLMTNGSDGRDNSAALNTLCVQDYVRKVRTTGADRVTWDRITQREGPLGGPTYPGVMDAFSGRALHPTGV